MKVMNQVCHHENEQAALDVFYHAPSDTVHFFRYPHDKPYKGMEVAFSCGFLLLEGVVAGAIAVKGSHGLLGYFVAQQEMSIMADQLRQAVVDACTGFEVETGPAPWEKSEAVRMFVQNIVSRVAKARGENPVALAADADPTVVKKANPADADSLAESMARASRRRGSDALLELLWQMGQSPR